MSQLNWCYCIHCECMRVAYDDVILDCYVDWHGCNIFGSLCVLRRIRAMSLFLLLVETHCSKHVTCSMLLCFGCPTASARLVPATQPQTLWLVCTGLCFCLGSAATQCTNVRLDSRIPATRNPKPNVAPPHQKHTNNLSHTKSEPSSRNSKHSAQLSTFCSKIRAEYSMVPYRAVHPTTNSNICYIISTRAPLLWTSWARGMNFSAVEFVF